MQPRPTAPTDLDYWREHNPRPTTFTPPTGLADAEPCEAIVTDVGDEVAVVRVPWSLSAEEVEQLAAGGTLWLSTWGGLPPHQLEVQPSPAGKPAATEPSPVVGAGG